MIGNRRAFRTELIRNSKTVSFTGNIKVRLLSDREITKFKSHMNLLCTGAQPKPIRLDEK